MQRRRCHVLPKGGAASCRAGGAFPITNRSRIVRATTGWPTGSPRAARLPRRKCVHLMLNSVLIVAAGRGRRLGGEVPKQFIPVAGVCSLRRTLDLFLALRQIGAIRIVIHPDDHGHCEEALQGLQDDRLLGPVHGGSTRARSVRLGLEALSGLAPDRVLIHDAARPFVSHRIILEVLSMLEDADGAVAALPVVDALWKSHDGHVTTSVPREGLWRAQTPQGFRFDRILAAHRQNDGDAVDDVAVARSAGLDVRIVPGSEANFKITTVNDLERARREIARAGVPRGA